jgi:membrane-associated protease RseP (regulator of RpoE activity)
MKGRPCHRLALLLVCALFLGGIGPALAATGDTDLSVDLEGGKLTVKAENVPLKKILDGIYGAYPLVVRGLEGRSDEVLDFTAEHQDPEKMFRRLLRQLGETNYAFEFRGQRLSRVSVMPEAKGGAVARPIPDRPRPALPEEEQVSVVRVDRIIDGSQAQELGIQSGDLVVQYDGEKITDPGDLIRAVKQKSDAPSVGMVLLRNGTPLNLTLRGGFIGIHIVPQKVPRERVAGYLD